MLWRTAAAVLALMASVVLGSNIHVARNHFSHISNLGDLLIVALPIMFPVLALMTGLAVGIVNLKGGVGQGGVGQGGVGQGGVGQGGVGQGAVRGAFVASNLVVAFLAWQLWNNSGLVAKDGTAYWGLIFLPCFWLGIPILFSGVGLGVAAHYIRRPTEHA